jgi:hypothetical protein
MDPERVSKEWYESKIIILNSKIFENLITSSLKDMSGDDITMGDNGFKIANGRVKMKFFKAIVNKLGCTERNTYYINSKGDNFTMLPMRDFFRKYYDDILLQFDYHVKFVVSEDEDMNDFTIKLNLDLKGEKLLDLKIIMKYASGEMSGKLSAKYKFNLSDRFNYQIAKLMTGIED